MKWLNGMFAKAMNRGKELAQEETGSQTLEWIGIAAVIVILVGVVSTAFADGDFGDTLVGAFNDMISTITGGE
ncbi:hypothetical protein [Lentibacillus sediminis]|uniref:hypothetical protein n=1 Tax=Lentibacillus sediminis TaxID=1940529 RepID=UPI000C1C5770|nr:hypothetical protein [Lentibacillus sediminis]